MHIYIITGSSRGLGLALAHQLMKPANQLLCIARHTNPQLDAAAQGSSTALTQWSLDLAHGDEAAKRLANWLAQASRQACQSVTLINNAALLPAIAPLSDTPSADIASVLRIGLEAPLHLTAAFLNSTAGWTQSGGAATRRRVLTVSSGLGRNAMASQALYCAAKAGIDHFTRCLALEEAAKPDGARVCAIAPGVIDTDMQGQMRSANPEAFAARDHFANLKKDGQLSSPADCAAKLLDYLERPDFGSKPIADIREII